VRWLARLALLATLAPQVARAVQVEALEAADWQLRALRFQGNVALGSRELRRAIVTKARSRLTPWRPRPPFDPVAFRTDLERLRSLYRRRGYYRARVEHDIELPATGRAITAVVYIAEGPPVHVERVDVALEGVALPDREQTRLRGGLPIAPGEVFTEEAFERAFTYLHAYYREHGFARVKVTKHAEVDLARESVAVSYRVESGPASVFGRAHIQGAPVVGAAVVERELAFEPGEPFRQSLLDRTRQNLAGLNLFRTIRIDEHPGETERVDLRIHLVEAPPREVRFGIGYDTEEQVRGLAGWRHYDFLGGARQLGFTARASLIERAIAADFLQPHFPGQSNRSRLLFAQAQEEEDTYTLDRTRLGPRLEWQATPQITGFVFHRAEYDSLSSVSLAVKKKLAGGVPKNIFLSGFLSGLGFGADWNTTDDLLDPSRGFVTSATVEPVGGFLGGDINFVRVIGEGRLYEPLLAGLSGAARLRLGSAEPLDGTSEIPLFERFFAGGLNSVRGYGRRRIGPLVDDEPIGGRSLVETALELRHPITDTLGAAVFVDAGQVSLKSFDFPFGHLRYGTGVGARYKSPVGPLRVDLAFPVQPPDGDQRWQVHVNLGAAF
jgi:outer membrane protein assembly complex protein YaeT